MQTIMYRCTYNIRTVPVASLCNKLHILKQRKHIAKCVGYSASNDVSDTVACRALAMKTNCSVTATV